MRTKESNKKAVAEWTKRNSNPCGVVYEILNVVTGDNYVGSTKGPLKKRMWQAIAAANGGKTGALYDNMRLHGKDSFIIRVIHECTTDDSILEEENRCILEFTPNLNMKFAKKIGIFKVLRNFY